MKRPAFVLMSVILLVFASCDNIYDEDAAEEPKMTQAATWQKAYAALLRAYYEEYDGEYRLFFLLHDIDMDGIPELFISEQGCWVEHIDVVYTFRDGRAISLEFGEDVTFMAHLFSAGGPYLTANIGNAPGIVTRIGGVGSVFGGNYWANLIVIDGNSLVVKYRGEWIVDVAALLELGVSGNDFDAIMKHTTITINGNAVSEEEFSQKFGHRGSCVHFLRPHLITENNIRDIIFGWPSAAPVSVTSGNFMPPFFTLPLYWP